MDVILYSKLMQTNSALKDVQEDLGLVGEYVNFGTDCPLKIETGVGTIVDLEFDTASSCLISNKNLCDFGTKTFERSEGYNLPFALPAGDYTFSADIVSSDTDSSYCLVTFMDANGTAVASGNILRGTRKAKALTATRSFTRIVLTASDSYSHATGDEATFSDIQLEFGDTASRYIAYSGKILAVDNAETFTTEFDVTYIITDDFSDVTASTKGINPVIPVLKSSTEKSDAFIEANDLEGNTGKINILQVPYELSDFTDNSMIRSNGSILTGDSYKAYMVTPLIPVDNAGLYGLKISKESNSCGAIISGKNGFGFYDIDGTTAISRTDSNITNISGNIYTLNVPNGTAYVRFTVYKNAESYQSRALAQFNQWIFLPDANASITDEFFTLRTPKANKVIDRIMRSDGSYLSLYSSGLKGKNILVFGDSIWGNDRTNGVADFLAEYSGATIYNCAFGGTWICGDRSQASGGPAWTAFDGVNIIHAKMTNTWTDQDQYVGDVTSYAEEVLTLLKSVDMSKIDIVILSYGTNDFSNDKTASAIASAYATAISEILTGYPRIRFLLCSPAWRMFNTTDGDVYENANNETLRDVVDAIVEMAKENHVEALDMLHHCPWRALTKGYYLDSDEVHPNTEGNKVYAHVVHGKLRSMY